MKRRQEIPFWLIALALGLVASLWWFASDADYGKILRALSGGLLTTVWVTAVAFAFALVLGLLLALARTSRIRVLRELSTFYVELVRGIPVLVLLFYFAFVGAPFLVQTANVVLSPLIAQGWIEPVGVRDFDLVWRAIMALTIAYSAFIAEIIRAGIEAVDRGQVEAAMALGLSRRQTFRHIIAPQALRIVLPPLGNDFISMLKDSALVSALGVQDITQLGKVYSSGSFLFFETYNVVAFLYLSMTLTLSLLVRLLEHRLARGRKTR